MKKSAHLLVIIALVGAALAQEALQSTNYVVNPGFEQINDQGATLAWGDRPPVYRFMDGTGRNGSRGLVYENTDPNHYSFPSQVLNIEPGYSYQYEVWVRTEDLRGNESGATICMEWSEKGKWAGGNYATGVRDTTADWQLVKGVTPVIPTNVTRINISPYVRRGMTGKAWFDDLKVTRYHPPMVNSINVSTYRNIVTVGPYTFNAGLALHLHKSTPDQFEGEFLIVSTDNKTTLRRKADSLSLYKAEITLADKELPPGTYNLKFELKDKSSKTRGTATTHFTRMAQMPQLRSYIDKHKRLILDGEPFFPLGTYWGKINSKDLDIYAKSPFNALMPYNSPDVATMDACHEKGLKVVYSVKDIFHGTSYAPKNIKTEQDEINFVRNKVEEFRNHPALMAWYTNDELPVTMLDRLTARQKLMEELDPHHPTWAVLYQYEQIDSYLPTFDVVGTDPYPIPTKPVGTALEWTRSTRDLSFNSRALWQVPQIFDWAGYKKRGDQARPPTLAEMRAMAWQCIAAGANGLFFYSYFDLHKMNEQDPFETRWQDVCTMAAEIKRYIPVMLSVEPTPKMQLNAPDTVEVRLWRKGPDLYLLAVNGGETAANAAIKLAGSYRSMTAEFGKAPVKTTANSVELTLDPLEPAMLKLTSK